MADCARLAELRRHQLSLNCAAPARAEALRPSGWSMSSRIRVEGTAVVFPDARSDVVFVKHRVLVAGTRADKGSLCLLTQTDKGEEDIFAGPDKETDAVARVCVVDCPEGASVVGVAGDELLKFALPGLERKAELFRGTLKLRAVSARPGSRWV